MANTGSNPIRRAAGVILWHLEKGHSNAESVAKASKREPQMTEEQLRYALGWANAAQTFRDIMALCKQNLVQTVDEETGKVRYVVNDGHKQCTVAEALEASNLDYFRDPSNFPPDA